MLRVPHDSGHHIISVLYSVLKESHLSLQFHLPMFKTSEFITLIFNLTHIDPGLSMEVQCLN